MFVCAWRLENYAELDSRLLEQSVYRYCMHSMVVRYKSTSHCVCMSMVAIKDLHLLQLKSPFACRLKRWRPLGPEGTAPFTITPTNPIHFFEIVWCPFFCLCIMKFRRYDLHLAPYFHIVLYSQQIRDCAMIVEHNTWAHNNCIIKVVFMKYHDVLKTKKLFLWVECAHYLGSMSISIPHEKQPSSICKPFDSWYKNCWCVEMQKM
jgi:hypothetical protein